MPQLEPQGTECQVNDIFKTGADSVLDVSINNQAGARILSSSESSITGTQADQMKIRVLKGAVLLNIEKLSRGMYFIKIALGNIEKSGKFIKE